MRVNVQHWINIVKFLRGYFWTNGMTREQYSKGIYDKINLSVYKHNNNYKSDIQHSDEI